VQKKRTAPKRKIKQKRTIGMSFKNGLLENTRHGRNAGMTKLALLFTKERIELFSPRDAFLNMARNTC